MAVQSLTTIDKLLKEQYIDKIVDAFNEEVGVLGEVTKRKQAAKGHDTEILVRVGRNTGIGFRGDGETLPSAGSSSWVRHVVDPKAFYGRIQVSGLAMARSDGGSAKAFLKAFVDETKHTMKHMKKRANIELWGQEEGYLGKVASVAAGALTLDGPGTAEQITTVFQRNGTKAFQNGDVLIDVLDASASNALIRAGVPISSVTHASHVLNTGTPASGDADMTASTAVADGDLIRLATGVTTLATAESALPKGFEGIGAAIDDGDIRTTYHGLSRTTYPLLKSNVRKNTTALRDLTEALMEDLVKDIMLNSGSNPTAGGYQWRGGLGVHSEFLATQLPIRRFASNVAGKAGFSDGPSYSGVPFVADVDAPAEALFLLKWDNFKFLETDALRWLDIDGRVLDRVTDKDQYEARLRWYGDLVACDVQEMGVIRNLNDTTYSYRA